MKSLVFDSGAIISLATNNLLWLLGPLKKHFKGSFYIPKTVKGELIDKPLKSLRFRLEAMQVLSQVAQGHLNIYEKGLDVEIDNLLDIVNTIFKARGRFVDIAHRGEMAVVALAKKLNADALVIDERTTRVLIEDPKSHARLLARRLHTHISIDRKKLDEFRDYTKDMRVIRSTELGLIAYELGFLNKYILPEEEKFAGNNLKKILLEGLLWGLKLRGCSISEAEISDLLKIEGFTRL